MEIIGIAGTLPSKQVTNQDILDSVLANSHHLFKGDLPRTLTIIEKLLAKNGTNIRHWLAEDESPMELMAATFTAALAQANINKKDIDLLLFSSICRGFIEPANSTFIAKSLGLTCRNHDVIDACMGWVTSMDIINDKMKAGAVRYAAIVNMEFGMTAERSLTSKNYSLRSVSELSYKLPSYTLGEAVTVTLLSHDSADNFNFTFINRPDLSDLCTIALPGWRSFCSVSDATRIGCAEGSLQFTSFGDEMHKVGVKESVELLNNPAFDKSKIDCIFTHTSSPRTNEFVLQQFNMAEKNHTVGHHTGNIGTASLPFGIADALKKGALIRGQSCLGMMGSAGMVFSAMTFDY